MPPIGQMRLGSRKASVGREGRMAQANHVRGGDADAQQGRRIEIVSAAETARVCDEDRFDTIVEPRIVAAEMEFVWRSNRHVSASSRWRMSESSTSPKGCWGFRITRALR